MANQKLTALSALTSAGDDDILYIADTADSGSSYTSKKITKSNLFSGIATETYVTSAISNLVDFIASDRPCYSKCFLKRID